MSAPSDSSFVPRARAFARELARRGRRLRLPQTAASLAFLSLFALVPVFTIAVSLLGALPVLSQPRATLLNFLATNLFLPSFSETLVRLLNQFAAKVNELSVVGAAVFFATAFSALLTIDRTLNRIWATGRPRPLARRLTIYWTFLTLGPLMVAASAAVNGIVVSELLGAAQLRHVERAWLSTLPWLMSVGGLTLLYRIVPNAPVRWREALAGAIVAAVGLEVLKRLLAFQVAKLPTYTVVYGAFAALPLFLVWLFALWLTVLAGALVAACIPDWGRPGGSDAPAPPSAVFERGAAVLEGLALAAARGSPMIQPSQCAALCGLDAETVDAVAAMLADLRYIDRYWRLEDSAPGEGGRGIWDERWALRPGAGGMTLRPLFEKAWHGREAARAMFEFSRVDATLVELARTEAGGGMA